MRLRRQMSLYNRGTTESSVCDGTRILMGSLLLEAANECIKGHYAELGTYRGNFARIIWQHLAPNSRLYCFDTFEGFNDKDVEIENQTSGLKAQAGYFRDTSIALVRNNILENAVDDRLILVKGYFPETFSGLESLEWRFVLIDCDLYEPVRKGLELFWPKIVPGGVLFIHDYGATYIGVRKAVDEYFGPLGIVPIPLPDMAISAAVIKNRG